MNRQQRRNKYYPIIRRCINQQLAMLANWPQMIELYRIFKMLPGKFCYWWDKKTKTYIRHYGFTIWMKKGELGEP